MNINKNSKINISFRLNNYFNECFLLKIKNSDSNLSIKIDNYFRMFIVNEEKELFIKNTLSQGKLYSMILYFNNNLNIEIDDMFKCCLNSLDFNFNNLESINTYDLVDGNDPDYLEQNGVEILKFEEI